MNSRDARRASRHLQRAQELLSSNAFGSATGMNNQYEFGVDNPKEIPGEFFPYEPGTESNDQIYSKLPRGWGWVMGGLGSGFYELSSLSYPANDRRRWKWWEENGEHMSPEDDRYDIRPHLYKPTWAS